IKGWENKILFGTDSNYFGVPQAADFITFLLSTKFLDLLAENETDVSPLTAVSKILGGNALRIIPNPWKINTNNTENQTKGPKKKSNKIKLKGDIPIFIKSLKKYLNQTNNFATIDLAKIPQLEGTLQVLTLGNISDEKSYIISLDKKYQKITFFPYLNKLEPESKVLVEDISKVKQIFKLRQKGRSHSLTEDSLLEIW
ncbi:MAG: hypothetical protein ACW964_18040, partial [Candidatus Hodarchaeales archaeon]